MASLEDKKKEVMEKCHCTADDAEGALRRAGFDTDMAVKSIQESFKGNQGGFHKTSMSALRQAKGLRLNKEVRAELSRNAELAEQGWEEVGGKSKIKKLAGELRKMKEKKARSSRRYRREENASEDKEEPKEVKEEEPKEVKEEPVKPVEEVKEPVKEPEPVVKEEPAKEPEQPKVEEVKAEPAKEPEVAKKPEPAPRKEKLSIIRRAEKPAEKPAEPEKPAEAAPAAYNPPLVASEPAPAPAPAPAPVEPAAPARHPLKITRKEQAEKVEPPKEEEVVKKEQPAPAPAPVAAVPAPAPAQAPVVTPVIYVMPVDKEAFHSLYPNYTMGQLMHLPLMPYKFLQDMKPYLIPLSAGVPAAMPPAPECAVPVERAETQHYNPLNF